MTMHPDIQEKAQKEIDQVVGSDRLPGLKDRANLPYVDSIVKEVLRWHPVAPLGLPHMTTQDDICEGYLVPKGALILANIWFVLPILFNAQVS
jgi:cytochrome P450